MCSPYERTIVLFVVAAAIAGLLGTTSPTPQDSIRPAAQPAGTSAGNTAAAPERKPRIH